MKIRVNPVTLFSNSLEIIKISNELNTIANEIQQVSNSAPSYNGQFGPKVSGIGYSLAQNGRTQAANGNERSNDLQKIADRFSAADSGVKLSALFGSLNAAGDWRSIALTAAGINHGIPWDKIAELWETWNKHPEKFSDRWNNWLKDHFSFSAWEIPTGKNSSLKLFNSDGVSFLPLDKIEWSGLGIFQWKSDDLKITRGNNWASAEKTGGGWQFKADDDKSTWDDIREKYLKFDVPLINFGGSVAKWEGANSRTDKDGNVVSRGAGSVEVGKWNVGAKMTVGGEDWLSAEAGAEVTLASGKYTHVWGKEDDFVQGYFDGNVDVMKASAKVGISSDGVEAKVGFSVVEASASGGANIGDYRVGVTGSVRVGMEWGFSAKNGKVAVDLGPFSIGLDIGRKKTV